MAVPRLMAGAALEKRYDDTSLSINFGDGLGGGGDGLRFGDDLDPVVECHTEERILATGCGDRDDC